MIGKKNEKNSLTVALNVLNAIKKKNYPAYVFPAFRNITQIVQKIN